MKSSAGGWKAVVTGLWCVAIAAGVLWGILRTTSEALLLVEAEHNALAWAQFVGATVDNIDQVFAGKGLSPQGRADIRHVRQVQDIFRFKLYDPAGRLVLSSERLDAGADLPPSTPDPDDRRKVARTLETGRSSIELKRGTDAALPPLFSETFVPVRFDGRLLGVVQVYGNQEGRQKRLNDAFAAVAASVSVLLVLSAGLVGWRGFIQAGIRRRTEERLRYLARHDSLSGALNRASFDEALDRAVERHHASGVGFAVLCLDLDKFRDVNDTHGAALGDEVLRQLGERLAGLITRDDCVARLGGDHFALLHGGATGSDTVAAFAQRVVERLAQPYAIEGGSVRCGASLGAAIFGIDAAKVVDLMHRADLALSRAKAAGGGTFSVYDAALDGQLDARRRLASDLRLALERQQFKLHYQPLFGADASTLHGYEALLRWTHPERGNVSPADFIPVAEAAGLIDAIGRWVLKTACEEAASWPSRLTVAVNLSAAQFRDGRLAETVRTELASSGLPAERLELEITESLLMSDAAAVMSALKDVAATGVRIAMDDFGTGYSSLAYLWRFPFDKLKIDRSFTQHLGVDYKVDMIVNSIVTLAHSMGMRVNAEGVETPEQLQALRRCGCDELQGFLLGRPGPADGLPHLAEQLDYGQLSPRTDFGPLLTEPVAA